MNFLKTGLLIRSCITKLQTCSLNLQRGTGIAVRNAKYSTSSSTISSERTTAKHPLSRNTFLVDYYKYLNDNNDILLYVHHNNLVKAENKKVRSELKALGATFHVLRNSIYEVYLRSESEADPADKNTSIKNKHNKHPLSPLLNGPTGVISIPQCEPRIVQGVLKVIKSANEKLILIGAKIDSSVYDTAQVDSFKDLPNKEQLQSQLAGMLTILGGAGLVRTLENTSNFLYLTLEERRKDMDENKDE